MYKYFCENTVCIYEENVDNENIDVTRERYKTCPICGDLMVLVFTDKLSSENEDE